MYIEKSHHSGPDNLSIRGLTEYDLEELRAAIGFAENYFPRENMQRLLKEIETYLGVKQ